jgi:hypothetical protein
MIKRKLQNKKGPYDPPVLWPLHYESLVGEDLRWLAHYKSKTPGGTIFSEDENAEDGPNDKRVEKALRRLTRWYFDQLQGDIYHRADVLLLWEPDGLSDGRVRASIAENVEEIEEARLRMKSGRASHLNPYDARQCSLKANPAP